MGHDDLVIIGRVMGALVIGALIGFERTFHGRPAGFRTHSLVCIASAILMIVTVYQSQWMTFVEHDAISCRTWKSKLSDDLPQQADIASHSIKGAPHSIHLDV
jgi:hypothetical protein